MTDEARQARADELMAELSALMEDGPIVFSVTKTIPVMDPEELARIPPTLLNAVSLHKPEPGELDLLASVAVFGLWHGMSTEDALQLMVSSHRDAVADELATVLELASEFREFHVKPDGVVIVQRAPWRATGWIPQPLAADVDPGPDGCLAVGNGLVWAVNRIPGGIAWHQVAARNLA